MTSASILLVDHESAPRDGLARLLGDDGFRVIVCADGKAALDTLRRENVDALVTELEIPGVCGLELIQKARELRPGATVIATTALDQVKPAVEAMKAGATDCLRKPIDIGQLRLALRDPMAQRNRPRHNGAFRGNPLQRRDSAEIVGGAPSMVSLLNTVNHVARDRRHVLISGERGTGKRLLSRAIFMAGDAGHESFHRHNCQEFSETFLNGETFRCIAAGHSGAAPNGMRCDAGTGTATLALYDIDNLAISIQARLMCAIARSEAPVPGGLDLRVIATTSRDLRQAVDSGTFDADLFACLAATRIDVPPLRDRREDIPALSALLLRNSNVELNSRCPGIAPAAVDVLRGLPWPGNVRELQNALERALILCDDREIEVAHLVCNGNNGPLPSLPGLRLREATKLFERGHILSVLERVDNNKATAAKMLGLGLSSLYRKLEDFEVPRSSGRGQREAGP